MEIFALREKRVGAVDYGLQRVGLAVCDELHIVCTPRGFMQNTPDLVESLQQFVARERLGALVVGVPYRVDGVTTPLITEIQEFIGIMRKVLKIPVFEVDEAFSSKRASELMVTGGTKKKKRAQKGQNDAVAAALILRSFLEEGSDNRG